jgi:hypothetical protein
MAMNDEVDIEMEPFGGYLEYDEAELEREGGSCAPGSASPGWQAAWRFANAIRAHGFLPRQHFIERLCERGIGVGVKFDPRTFRREFLGGAHYRQTRPGYSLRVAVVRKLPILYRMGGWRGNQIVLAGALPVGAPPPGERTRPPVEREAPVCHQCSKPL